MYKHARLGADPELFLVDHHGKLVSAIGKFGGTKRHPKPIPSFPDGFAIQEDNVAVEFNIPPSDSEKSFVNNIKMAMDYLSEAADKMNLKIHVVASGEFSQEELANPRAQEFGCEPDFNVWTMQMNPRPHAKNKNLRSCGGHVHIEYKDVVGIGRACDLFLGIPSVVFDKDLQRRSLYGAAGCVRHKSYGVEYRTLSNFWVASEDLTRMVYEQAQKAVEFVDKGMEIDYDEAMKIIDGINNTNMTVVRSLIKKYNMVF